MKIRRIFTILSLFALVAIGVIMFNQRSGYRSISTGDAVHLIKTDTNVVLLDVRTPEEFSGESGHLSGARLIPLQELEHRLEELNQVKQKKIIAYCRTGRRSANASILLARHGFTVLNLEGGIVRWLQEGLPVVKGVEK